MPDTTRGGTSRGGHIVLLGMMGSGKTTIGAALADQIDRPFVESDEALRASAGRDAARIAAEDGVETLHTAEQDLLLDALQAARPAVIAAAASVVESVPCRRALAHHTCLWLDADAATLAARQGRAGHRRTFGDPPAALAELKRRRDPFYADMAAIRIDTGATDPDQALAVALAAAEDPSHSA